MTLVESSLMLVLMMAAIVASFCVGYITCNHHHLSDLLERMKEDEDLPENSETRDE